MMPGGREEMIVDFKPRLFFRPAIKAAEVCEKIELQAGSGLEKSAGGHDQFARNDDGGFAQRFDDFGHAFRMLNAVTPPLLATALSLPGY